METSSTSPSIAGLRARLDERIDAHDRPGAVSEALRAVDSGEVSLRELYHEILAPLMVDMGSRWQAGEVRVWQEHLASGIVRTIVDALYPRVQELKATVEPTGSSVLLACPADEQHDLGLRMLSDMFDATGWTTHLLGADTPTRQITEAASALDVDLVLLASTTLVDRVEVRHVLDAIHRDVPGVRVVVSGCETDCEERGLLPEEVFHAAEFFGGAQGTATPPDARPED